MHIHANSLSQQTSPLTRTQSAQQAVETRKAAAEVRRKLSQSSSIQSLLAQDDFIRVEGLTQPDPQSQSQRQQATPYKPFLPPHASSEAISGSLTDTFGAHLLSISV
jgi:hypothetical protein